MAVEIRFGERQRLLHPDMLAGEEGGPGDFAMLVVARRDKDRGDSRVVEQGSRVSGRHRGVSSKELGGKPVSRSEGRWSGTKGTECRDEDACGEISATDDPDATSGPTVPIGARQRTAKRIVGDGIFDKVSVRS